jgi:hypothetical protein
MRIILNNINNIWVWIQKIDSDGFLSLFIEEDHKIIKFIEGNNRINCINMEDGTNWIENEYKLPNNLVNFPIIAFDEDDKYFYIKFNEESNAEIIIDSKIAH